MFFSSIGAPNWLKAFRFEIKSRFIQLFLSKIQNRFHFFPIGRDIHNNLQCYNTEIEIS